MELVDVYDEVTGLKTGEVVSKDKVHAEGIWHSSIHVILFNEDRTKVLLQKRCEKKKLYPGMWDITVGGHISSGEEALEAALREFKEELGIVLDKEGLEDYGITKEEFINNGVNSKEFVHIYVVVRNYDIKDIVLQDDEVSKAKWFTKDELEGLKREGKIIRHDKEFDIIGNILQ